VISVFDYLDYREYLGAYYRFKKERSRYFSYRMLADKGGFASTGYISEVIGGVRNLTRSNLPKIGKAFELNDRELAYLTHLVEFNHARTEAGKQAAYQGLVSSLPPKAQQLKQSHLEYFSKWYYVAVREALAIHAIRDGKDDNEALAKLLRPRITAAQAKAALRLLADLRLIHRDGDGRWHATHGTVLSQDDAGASLMVRSFQSEMINLARLALQEVPKGERHISTQTMSVSPRGLQKVVAILEESHRRILEVVAADHGEDRVVQLNMQIFPITQTEGGAHAL
jgi:uncharacterized protein (TIGR02147 family)